MKKRAFVKILMQVFRTSGSLAEGIIAGEPFDFLDLRLKGYDPHKIRTGFYNLRLRKYIKFTDNKRVVFTRKGKEWINKNQLYYFKDQFKKWDHKWRVVIFDIPQEKSLERQRFRRRLLTMGFHSIQKSVFVFPYPCEKEISKIARDLIVSDYVDVLIAEFPGFKEQELLKFFKL